MAKLVRDKIPNIMAEQGKDPHIHFASDEEYWKMLKEKLKEEMEEFTEAKDASREKDELADILEVVEAVCKFRGYKKMDIEAIKNSKALERGKFDKRIILE